MIDLDINSLLIIGGLIFVYLFAKALLSTMLDR
jgi:hypothetical protein